MSLNGANCGVNLTSNKVRMTCGTCGLRKYQLDPSWGIPVGGIPMFQDPSTHLIRPASSAVSLSLVCDNFRGFATEIFPPGECHMVQVASSGWVEMKLLTPQIVYPGQLFKFTTETDGVLTWVSNDFVEPADDADDCAVLTAVKGCVCGCDGKPLVCPPTPAAPANTSPYDTDLLNRATQRTVLLAWCTSCGA